MIASSQKNVNQAKVSLKTSTLGDVPNSIETPHFDRKGLKCGIVHMSVGGFHRSHQALYIQDILNKSAADWMIAGVGLLDNDKQHVDTMNAQDCLYSVLERSGKKDTLKVCGSIKEIYHAPSSNKKVLERLNDESIKILSLTITEKGYCYNQDGDLDLNHEAIKHDLVNLMSPRTGLGYTVSALNERYKSRSKPFTVMSCDNLPGNGHLTHKLVLQFAQEIDSNLASWISENVSFPNAMVDRITPVTTPDIIDVVAEKFSIDDRWPVVCEDFRQWVLEDKFCNGRPDFESVGVQLVSDVEPYEKMKVRLLNGSHSALSYLSYLMGYRRVDAAMADPLISKYVRSYMDYDVTPAVPFVPGIDLDTYKDKLIERFSNPSIGDQVQRLAEDGSRKIPNAILPCIRNQLEKGGNMDYAALALACWFRYLSGSDESLNAIEIKDPSKDRLMERIRTNPQDPTYALGLEDIFGDLGAHPIVIQKVKIALNKLYSQGVKKTLEECLAKN
jgi:mannitol 2-dehydrogenase